MKTGNPVTAIILIRTLQASALALPAHWLLHWPFSGPHALGLFLTPLLCIYFLFVFVAPWSWGLPITTRLPTRDNAVALTFDDGPSRETTPRILDVLKEREVLATFFVLGEAVARCPDILRRIVSEGHSVGIHAYAHKAFPLLGRHDIEEEIRQTQLAIVSACSEAALSPWVRPPYGFKSPVALWAVQRMRKRLVTWSVNGRDYDEQRPDQIAGNLLLKLRPGDIVLLHDGPRNTQTIAALPPLLDGLRERGCHCVPLSATGSGGGQTPGAEAFG